MSSGLGAPEARVDPRHLPLAPPEIHPAADRGPVVARSVRGVDHLVVLLQRSLRGSQQRPDVVEEVNGEPPLLLLCNRKRYVVHVGSVRPSCRCGVQKGDARQSRATDITSMNWMTREEQWLLDGKHTYLAAADIVGVEALEQHLTTVGVAFVVERREDVVMFSGVWEQPQESFARQAA